MSHLRRTSGREQRRTGTPQPSTRIAGASITRGNRLDRAPTIRRWDSRSASIEEALHAAHRSRIRECAAHSHYTAAYALGQQADYRSAQDWLGRLWTDVREYDLEFARPHASWTSRSSSSSDCDDSERPNAPAGSRGRSGCPTRRSSPAKRTHSEGATSSADGHAEADAWRLTAEPVFQSRELIHLGIAEFHSDACAWLPRASARRRHSAGTRHLTPRSDHEWSKSAFWPPRLARDTRPQRRSACRQVYVRDSPRNWGHGIRSSAHSAHQSRSPHVASGNSIYNRSSRALRRSNDLGLARQAGFRTRSSLRPHQAPLASGARGPWPNRARHAKQRDRERALHLAVHSQGSCAPCLEKLGVRTRAQAVARLRMFSCGVAD